MANNTRAFPGSAGRLQQVMIDIGGGLFAEGVAVVDSSGAIVDLATLIKAEDAAHASGDKGIMMLTVRKDSAAATAGTDGDYQPPTTDSAGRMRTTNSSVDNTNNVTKVGRILTAGTVLSADGNTLTGTGVLARLAVANNHTTNDITVSVYDNTAASGSKLCPDFTVPPKGTVALDVEAPYSLGVYLDFGGTGTPSGIGYAQVVV